MLIMLRRIVLSSLVFAALAVSAVERKVAIMPESQVKPGMHGVAYTVFEGTKPEAMDVEILGTLGSMAGP
jgi:hypothetical protein